MNSKTATMFLALIVVSVFPAAVDAATFAPRQFAMKPIIIGQKFQNIGVQNPSRFNAPFVNSFQNAGTSFQSNSRSYEQGRRFMRYYITNSERMTEQFNGRSAAHLPGATTGFQAHRYTPYAMQQRHIQTITPAYVTW